MVETLKRNTLEVIPFGQWERSSAGSGNYDSTLHYVESCIEIAAGHIIRAYFLLMMFF